MSFTPALKSGSGSPRFSVAAWLDRLPQQAWRGVAGVLAVFVLAVAGVMLVEVFRAPEVEPWRSPELTRAREALAADPRNEAIKDDLRRRDQTLRQDYFRGLERRRHGAILLAMGGIGLVWACRRGWGRNHTPVSPLSARAQEQQRAQTGVLTLAALLTVGGVAVGLAVPVRLTGERAPGASVAAVPGGTVEAGTAGGGERAAQQAWPGFRGSGGAGQVPAGDYPLRWDVQTGQGVLWKAPLSLPGYSSPIVWGNRVFLTGGDKRKRSILCYEATTGSLLWERPPLPAQVPLPAIEPPDQSGQAASTPVTDGQRVYAVFGTGEIAALNFDGHLVWHRKLDFSENGYGHAASLVVHEGRLIVQIDVGVAEDGKSQLLALDAVSGAPVWSAKRAVGGSWCTPVVVSSGGATQIIAGGDPLLIGHDAVTGAERWRAAVLGGELAPSPVVAGDLVIAISPGHALSAVRITGSGDVTATQVIWKVEEDVPDVPSPVVVGDRLFTVDTRGTFIAREVATGKLQWKHDLELEVQASPLVVGDRIYLFGQPGKVVVLEAGPAFKELATSSMGDELYASPAAAGGRFFIRGKTTLFAVGGPTTAVPGGTATP